MSANSTFILFTFTAGAILGILFAPDSGKATRSKLSRAGNSFERNLEKELKKFEKAIHKQLKAAKKEIRDLVESRRPSEWLPEMNNVG